MTRIVETLFRETDEPCRCNTWAREGGMTFPRHHPNCERYDPTDVLPLNIPNYFRKMPSGAVFSDDRKYRYMLWRVFDVKRPMVHLVGLNPSKAGETDNDQTITKEIGFAKLWGYGAIVKTNLFALVSTDPAGLRQAVEEGRDPVGRACDLWIAAAAEVCDKSVFCYGDGGEYMDRYVRARKLIPEPYCLGVTQRGNPKHTSRLAYATPLVRMQS